jgi:hypothetical protein
MLCLLEAVLTHGIYPPFQARAGMAADGTISSCSSLETFTRCRHGIVCRSKLLTGMRVEKFMWRKFSNACFGRRIASGRSGSVFAVNSVLVYMVQSLDEVKLKIEYRSIFMLSTKGAQHRVFLEVVDVDLCICFNHENICKSILFVVAPVEPHLSHKCGREQKARVTNFK